MRGEAHGLPVTVTLLRDALGKLRAVEADHSRESPLRRVELYRGMKDVTAPASFMEQGGTELAPMSTTSDLSVAMRYSASVKAVLLRLITESFYERGPDISPERRRGGVPLPAADLPAADRRRRDGDGRGARV